MKPVVRLSTTLIAVALAGACVPEPRVADRPTIVRDGTVADAPGPSTYRAGAAYRPLAEFFHLNASDPLAAVAGNEADPWVDHSTQTALARRLDAAGVRLPLWRSVSEPMPGSFDWGATNRAVRDVAQSGLEPTLVLGGDWSDRFDAGDPNARREFAAWARAAAEQTSTSTTWYELWDAPNTSEGWRRAPDARRYAQLMSEAVPAIKRGNPGARVIGMGTLGPDLSFIEAAYENNAASFTDAVSYQHISSEKIEVVMEEEILALRRLMQRYGDGDSPLFITKFGLSTGQSTMVEEDDPETHAIWILKKHLVAMAAGVERVYYHKLMDGEDTNGDNGAWGLLESDATRKPAWRMYRTMTEKLAPSRFVGRAWGVSADAQRGDEAIVMIFRRPDASLFAVAWVRRDGANVDILLPAEGAVRVEDHMGMTMRTIEPEDGKVRIGLTSDPVYIEGLAPRAEVLAGVRVEPQHLYISPGETRTIKVSFTNPLNRSISIPLEPFLESRPNTGLEITSPAERLDIPARSTREIKLTATLARNARPFQPIIIRQAGRDTGVSWSMTVRHAEAFDVDMYAEPLDDNLWVWMDYRNLTADPMPVRVSLRSNNEVVSELTPQRPLEPGGRRSSSIVLPLETGETTITGSIISETGPRQEERLRMWVQPLRDNAPRIDGNLDDWDHIPPARLRPQQHQVVPPRAQRTIESEELSADVRLWWTTDTLYVAADVTDATPRMNPFTRNDLWRGDSLELYLGFQGPTRERQFGDRHFQIGLSPGSSTSPPFAWNWVPREREGVAPPAEGLQIFDAQVATRTTPRGYIIEAAIPLSEFGIAVSPGMVIGFTMHLNNRDDEATEGRSDTLIWNGTSNNWRDPSQWGVVVLRAQRGGENSPAEESEEAEPQD